MMCELRKLSLLIDTYDIKIRTQYIRSVANMWEDRLSGVTDNFDLQLNKSSSTSKSCGVPHTIDRFASNANKQMSRFYAKCRYGTAEAVDNMRLSGAE